MMVIMAVGRAERKAALSELKVSTVLTSDMPNFHDVRIKNGVAAHLLRKKRNIGKNYRAI